MIYHSEIEDQSTLKLFPQFFVNRRTNRVWSSSRVSTIYCYKRGRNCTIDFLRVRRPWARPWHWNPSAALIYTGRWTLGWLTRLLHRLEQLHNTPAAYIHTIHTCYVHIYNYIYIYICTYVYIDVRTTYVRTRYDVLHGEKLKFYRDGFRLLPSWFHRNYFVLTIFNFSFTKFFYPSTFSRYAEQTAQDVFRYATVAEGNVMLI